MSRSAKRASVLDTGQSQLREIDPMPIHVSMCEAADDIRGWRSSGLNGCRRRAGVGLPVTASPAGQHALDSDKVCLPCR